MGGRRFVWIIEREIAATDRWTEKETDQAQIETPIRNFLWDDLTRPVRP